MNRIVCQANNATEQTELVALIARIEKVPEYTNKTHFVNSQFVCSHNIAIHEKNLNPLFKTYRLNTTNHKREG